MISITFSGDSIREVATQAKSFAMAVLPQSDSTTRGTALTIEREEENGRDPWGYRPAGVGYPEPQFSPIDDGTEWNEEAIEDWLLSCSNNGKIVILLLAGGKVIDPREAYEGLGLDGSGWSGTWIGPRKQAARIKKSRQLNSWPYGHSYEEPRRLWMHPTICDRVFKVMDKIKENKRNSNQSN